MNMSLHLTNMSQSNITATTPKERNNNVTKEVSFLSTLQESLMNQISGTGDIDESIVSVNKLPAGTENLELLDLLTVIMENDEEIKELIKQLPEEARDKLFLDVPEELLVDKLIELTKKDSNDFFQTIMDISNGQMFAVNVHRSPNGTNDHFFSIGRIGKGITDMEGKVITNGESTKPSRDSILLEILNRITSKVVDGSTKAQGSETVEKKDTNPPLFHNQMGNHHMSRLHQFAFHTSEKNEVSDQQILRQFQQILGKSHFQTLGNGIQQLTLKLHPQSLGRVDITLQQVNGVLVAKLMTTTTLAKEALEGQLYQLRHAFLGQQIQVDRIEITQQQTQQFVLKDQQHSGHHDRQEEQHTQKQDNESDLNEEGEPFSFLLEETINMEV